MLFSWLEFWWIYIGVSCHSVTLNWYLSCSILPVSPCTRCFGNDSKGVDGAADLLQVLGKATTLEELAFHRCNQIPAAAWQRLHGADWRNLKIARFDRQLGRGRGDVSWNWYLLFPLALVGDVNKCFGWMLKSHVDWLRMLFSWLEFWWIYIIVSCHSVTLNWYLCCSILPVSPCTRCFDDDSKGVDGAADLLQVLGKAMTLEELDFDRCSQIPAAAWQRLHGADWRNLKIARFDRQLGRGRGDVSWNWYLLFPLALVGDVNKCFGWMLRSHLDWLRMLFSWLEFWWIYIGVSCHSATLNWYLSCSILPVSPCTRCFGNDSKGVDGAADLLQVLGKATTLEELVFHRCNQIPAAAWQRLHGANWRNLKIASFVE